MTGRALIERRPWLLASLVVAALYHVLRDDNVPGFYLMLLELASLLLLSVYALLRHASADARLLAGFVTLSAVGVVLVGFSPAIGGIVLALGQGLAIAMFLRLRRTALTASQRAFATVVVVAAPLLAFLLTETDALRLAAALFGLLTGILAAVAWTSGYPRYRVGAGAVLYLTTTLLAMAGTGVLAESAAPEWFGWPLFYGAHFFICTGVIQTLRTRDRA